MTSLTKCLPALVLFISLNNIALGQISYLDSIHTKKQTYSYFMRTITKDNIIEIEADFDEKLEVVRQSIYSDRIVVFKTISENVLQEFHFDNHTGNLIDRIQRKTSLPKFEYFFQSENIIGTIEHSFLDELDFKDYKPKGIDIETIVVRLFHKGKEVSKIYHADSVNKFECKYFEIVQDCVKRYIEYEKDKNQNQIFLTETYSKWTSEEKANYHYGLILFQDRMQGGFPSRYKNPAAMYLSKWFIDNFSEFDSNIFSTIEQIAKSFDIDTTYLNEMIKYDIDSDEWQTFAAKLNLLNKYGADGSY